MKLTVIFGYFLGFISLVVIGLAGLFLSLPDAKLLKGCLTTELYHVYLCDASPHYVPLAEISPNIIGAVIMSEDASFYSHPGVDLAEMKISFEKDLDEQRFARGASTITQQLAKNVFLSKSKSIIRKLEEIYLAFQIEKYYTKGKILADYLNVVEFADGVYGVKDACRHYFNKSPSEITPEEGAFLAFLLPNPKVYSQSFTHGQLTPFAEKTIKTILHKMQIGHKITEDEYVSSLARVPLFPWDAQGPEVIPGSEGAAAPMVDEQADTEDNNFNFDFKTEDEVVPENQ